MSDLVEFLRARLDEDERIAKARADGADWMDFEPCRNTHHPHAEYLPHFAPYRMLAEVESKRRIIDWAIEYMEGDYAPWNETCLQLLALPYVDHPDFQESWRVG